MAGLFGHPNPFSIRHSKAGANKPGKQVRLSGGRGTAQLTWEKRELPGAGAQQYAWELLGLPPYPTFGYSGSHVTNPLRETFPASYVFQAVGIVGNPPLSIIQGQIITQPLMDPGMAVNNGIVLPGAVSGGPNAITNASPILAP